MRAHRWSILLMVQYHRTQQMQINCGYALTVNTPIFFLPKRSLHKLPANQVAIA